MRAWHHPLRSALFVPVLCTAWFAPPWLQRALVSVTIRFVHLLAPRLRRRIAKNVTIVARANGRELSPPQLRAAVLAVLANYGRYLIDFLGLRRARRDDLMRATHGSEKLRAASELGRGVILATAHLGSWEIAALFLAERSRSATLVSVPEEIGYLGDLRTTIRGGQNHGEVLLGNDPMAAIALLGKLREGGMVGMQLDRAIGASYTSVRFCGAWFKMPRGIARLAVASEALIVPGFALFHPDGGYEMVIEDAIDPRGCSESEVTQRLAALLERYVRAHPEQWLMMQDPWTDGPAGGEAEPDRRAAPAAAGAVA